MDYVLASAEAVYDESSHSVIWNLANVPVQSKGTFFVKIQTIWGTQAHLFLPVEGLGFPKDKEDLDAISETHISKDFIKNRGHKGLIHKYESNGWQTARNLGEAIWNALTYVVPGSEFVGGLQVVSSNIPGLLSARAQTMYKDALINNPTEAGYWQDIVMLFQALQADPDYLKKQNKTIEQEIKE